MRVIFYFAKLNLFYVFVTPLRCLEQVVRLKESLEERDGRIEEGSAKVASLTRTNQNLMRRMDSCTANDNKSALQLPQT